MMKLGPGGRKWLKGLHLCTVACWVGGGVALILLYFLKPGVTDGGVLYGMNQAIHRVDMAVVVIPGAFGCLLTGLAYSLFTGFGFFKHGWVILKWVVTVSAIVFGTVCLGPWERAMMVISGRLGIDALSDVAYLHNERLNFIWGLVQVAVLVATVFVSVFKPWKNLRKKSE
jgi:uncharacterized membrane protein